MVYIFRLRPLLITNFLLSTKPKSQQETRLQNSGTHRKFQALGKGWRQIFVQSLLKVVMRSSRMSAGMDSLSLIDLQPTDLVFNILNRVVLMCKNLIHPIRTLGHEAAQETWDGLAWWFCVCTWISTQAIFTQHSYYIDHIRRMEEMISRVLETELLEQHWTISGEVSSASWMKPNGIGEVKRN